MIPRRVHRLWFGGDVPRDAVRFGESWERHCPGWVVRTWRDWDLPPLINQDAFDAADHPAQKADLARLELLLRYGGIYVDTDFEALTPIEPLLHGVECFAASEDCKFVSTGIIGSIPDHPFIHRLVDRVTSSIAEHPGEPPNRQTGPYFVTRELQAYRRDQGGNGDVVVFPPELFYPYHFSEPERRSESFPNAVAVHHWSGSWTEEEPSAQTSSLASDPLAGRASASAHADG
jgi:mannosyltransferase OCH1-like enzyme